MNSNKRAAWLKAMENGSVGEARTRAFLMDQFWILERSVDVDGADFLIQVKPNEDTLLSQIPAKFGRVQSKFIQDADTSIRIKRAYVLKDNNATRTDFFLIINTGNAGTQKMYFLTANQIVSECRLDFKHNQYIFRINATSEQYLISDPLRTLQLIEDSINNTDFYDNRATLFPELAVIEANIDDIDPEYKIDLKFNLGLTYSIPEFFIEKKQEALEMMKVSIDTYDVLRRFIVSTDPMEAAAIAEGFARDYSAIFGSSALNLFDSNLYYRSRHHLDVVNTLRNDNALETYIYSRKSLEQNIQIFLDNNSNATDKPIAYRITVDFNISDFSIIDQEHSLVEIVDNKFEEYSFDNISKLIYTDIHITSRLRDGFPLDGAYVAMQIMEKIYELKYYEPN